MMDLELPGRYNPRLNEALTNEANREPCSEENFRKIYQFEPKLEKSIAERLKGRVRCSKETLPRLLPIIKWLPQYKKIDLLPDIMSGLTVAVMHIPQGMAYSLLGGVPPVVGIYMALFPVLIYILMGTSPHVSMGSFAIVSMMVGKSVAAQTGQQSALEVATAVCLAVGIWQMVFGLLKLGSLSVFLSHTLVSGFTTGAAVHVFTSQIKFLLGLSIERITGPFKILHTYYAIFTNIRRSNYIEIMLSLTTLIVLGSYNELIKPRLQRKFKRNIPIPMELIVVIAGTLLSTQFQLKDQYNVNVVNHVPTGLPEPKVPPMSVLPSVIFDGLSIAIVAITVTLSMANIFARKMNYQIDSNQEILASAMGNIFGSFFSCMPYAASLSRSLIQQSSGAKTQIANLVSCLVLVLVLLFIAPFFEPLPFSILSTIIIIALKGMFLQFRELVEIMKQSKLDGFVWLITFVAVVLLDIDIGLCIGLLASIGTILFRCQQPQVSVLGRIPGSQIYKDRQLYKKAQEVDGLLILEIAGGLHFANAEVFRKELMTRVLEYQTRPVLYVQDTEKAIRPIIVILRMSAVPYIDLSAIRCLEGIHADLTKLKNPFLLCDLLPPVYATLQKCKFFEYFPSSNVFPSISSAIDYLDRADIQGTSKNTIYHIA